MGSWDRDLGTGPPTGTWGRVLAGEVIWDMGTTQGFQKWPREEKFPPTWQDWKVRGEEGKLKVVLKKQKLLISRKQRHAISWISEVPTCYFHISQTFIAAAAGPPGNHPPPHPPLSTCSRNLLEGKTAQRPAQTPAHTGANERINTLLIMGYFWSCRSQNSLDRVQYACTKHQQINRVSL